MRLKLLVSALALGLAAPAVAQPQVPATPPRLIVAIAVDQLSADLFAQYRPNFTGGFRRLTGGVTFPAGYQSHNASETCPGHSTILTGARPARNGIIANTWFNPAATRADKAVYCAEDPGVPGSSSSNYTVSVGHLRVPALGEYLRRANPVSRTVAVAGKDRAAVMMAGRDPAQIWWWAGRAFISHAGRTAPASITRVNEAQTAAIALPRPIGDIPPVCAARARAVPVLGGGRPVGAGRLDRTADDRSLYRGTPEFDAAVITAAADLRDELDLGEGAATDLLILGLSATDYVGHYFGTQGQEMCLQLMALDRLLGEMFDRLDRTGVDYMVVLTSDHGGADIPERAAQAGFPGAARVDPALTAGTMGRAIGQQLRLTGPVLLGDGAFGDIYLDRAVPARQRPRVIAEAVRRYRAHPQVAAVFTRAELTVAPMPAGPPDEWSLRDRARASFDAERSGDLLVMLRPFITPIIDTSRGYTATHGSPWDYDRRVPILFWRRGMTGFEQPLPVETVDILPTLAGVLRLPLPAGQIDGRCLDVIEGAATNCP